MLRIPRPRCLKSCPPPPPPDTGDLLLCRDAVYASCFFEPVPGDLAGCSDAFQPLFESDRGHPHMGRLLKGLLPEAGIASVEAATQKDPVTREWFERWRGDLHIFADFVRSGAISREIQLCRETHAGLINFRV